MNLPEYRAKHGLSQAQLAERLTAVGSSASQALISQWERGTTKPPPERWQAIEDLTGGEVTRNELRPDIFPPAGPRQDEVA